MQHGEYKQKSGGENHEIRIMEHRGGRSENRRGSAARYLLDAISVAPEKKRPAVTSVQAAVMQEDLTGKRSR